MSKLTLSSRERVLRTVDGQPTDTLVQLGASKATVNRT